MKTSGKKKKKEPKQNNVKNGEKPDRNAGNFNRWKSFIHF